MMNKEEIQQLDLQHNWHPCSQMKDYETFKPLVVERAEGSYIELKGGEKLIDAISSWWCKSLGHRHPALISAVQDQLEQFEHIIFANTTNEGIANLSHILSSLMPGLDKVFYAGDGSCAVETAMKMSLHYRALAGQMKKTRFVSLRQGYHGETVGALSVSDLGIYRDAYAPVLFDPILIAPLYVSSASDAEWCDAEAHWRQVESILDGCKDDVTAVLVEPILQGAGGMHVYSQDFLSRLAHYAQSNDIHLIADEIMTGIGRTGKWLACEHAGVTPDFICLSKGLTSGWVSFSAVLTTNDIYSAFYDDYEKGTSFLHSHTYSGNALGVCLATATLQVMRDQKLCERACAMQDIMRQHFENISRKTGQLENIRGIGALIAADLLPNASQERRGYLLYQHAVKMGALLRPLGNTIYWMPPLVTSDETLSALADVTQAAIEALN